MREAEAKAAEDEEFEEAWRRLKSYSTVRNEALDWKLIEQIEIKNCANDFITNFLVTTPNMDEDLTEREETLDHGNTANVSADHDWMCDDHGAARSVEEQLVADLDEHEAHDDEIYCLNDRLLSARSRCAAVEARAIERSSDDGTYKAHSCENVTEVKKRH